MNLDDVAFKSITIDKNRQVVTYRKILEALTRKDEFCSGLYDELVRTYKQYLDYKKWKHNHGWKWLKMIFAQLLSAKLTLFQR